MKAGHSLTGRKGATVGKKAMGWNMVSLPGRDTEGVFVPADWGGLGSLCSKAFNGSLYSVGTMQWAKCKIFVRFFRILKC